MKTELFFLRSLLLMCATVAGLALSGMVRSGEAHPLPTPPPHAAHAVQASGGDAGAVACPDRIRDYVICP
ncbi:MAG: hypothetical protein ABFC67_10435 [Mizugakiibacter sp.]|uniref:hypothetical protein n=1 Tax=Mizugakiibacter sp. TaxID=1972610 RepID=UPI0031BC53EF|nr:hypothetical protein [Xanthomonadaceae bacterium]